ncbi:hypothetical protein [Caballeronia sp.]|uniref:hypothetical protein n=1 Tax=Caballeronia sp. TaxID=1931223 RepID=UPI003C53F64F
MAKFIIGSTGFPPFDNPPDLPDRPDPPVRRRLTRKEIERDVRPLDVAAREAMMLCLETHDRRFDRLPIPVRYRASGAIEAWTIARSIAGRDGAKLAAAFADHNRPVMELQSELDDFVTGCLGEAPFDADHRDLCEIYTQSAISQAFWLRKGALYEPTSALHRLLEASDIASDVPVSLLRLPAPAICIVPEPALRDSHDGFEAVMVFEHGSPAGWTENRCLTFCGWPHEDSPKLDLPVTFFSIEAGGNNASLQRIIAGLSVHFPMDDESMVFWRRALDYVVKVLLYLSLDVAPVIHERPYSTAPRRPAAPGKRKRLEQFEALESLYDRYIVGPAVLPEPSCTSASSNSTDHEVRAHWRRGHFRMQAHGPGATLRKLIFVMPVLVRADRLGVDAAP